MNKNELDNSAAKTIEEFVRNKYFSILNNILEIKVSGSTFTVENWEFTFLNVGLLEI